MSARSLLRALFALSLAVAAVLGALVALSAHPRTDPPAAQVRAAFCAAQLGIHWTPEDGATDHLDAFGACVR